MSLGILTLKIGLVTTVVGTSIATPILLNRGSGEINSEQVTSNSENRVDVARVGVAEGDRAVESQLEEVSPQRGGSEIDTSETSSMPRDEMSSATARVEDFDKKCFVIPANSDSESDIELLTCYDPKVILREDVGISDDDELESVFHLYDRSKPNNPVKIDGSLLWDPDKQQLTALLTKDADPVSRYTFVTKGSEWNRVSKESRNLMTGEECAIYKVSPEISSSSFLLTCGDYFTDYDPAKPEGIPLADWAKRS